MFLFNNPTFILYKYILSCPIWTYPKWVSPFTSTSYILIVCFFMQINNFNAHINTLQSFAKTHTKTTSSSEARRCIINKNNQHLYLAHTNLYHKHPIYREVIHRVSVVPDNRVYNINIDKLLIYNVVLNINKIVLLLVLFYSCFIQHWYHNTHSILHPSTNLTTK